MRSSGRRLDESKPEKPAFRLHGVAIPMALEHLTEPSADEVQADEAGGEVVEGEMDVGAAFIADGEATVATEPGQRALHDPAVATQAGAALDASSGDAWEDAPSAADLSAVGKVISLVRMKLAGPPARPAAALADRWDGINYALEKLTVVGVRRAEREREGDAVRVGEDVALCPWPAPVRRVGPGLFTPLFAGMLALSNAARLQSMALARPKRSSRTWCRRSQIPACCQSRKRRQHVIPEPQPISAGSNSQGMPLLSTNKMPVSAARWEISGRPPLGFGRSGGIRGAISAHSSSDTSGAAMHRQHAVTSTVPGFVRCSYTAKRPSGVPLSPGAAASCPALMSCSGKTGGA
jgi:hypothetical protein